MKKQHKKFKNDFGKSNNSPHHKAADAQGRFKKRSKVRSHEESNQEQDSVVISKTNPHKKKFHSKKPLKQNVVDVHDEKKSNSSTENVKPKKRKFSVVDNDGEIEGKTKKGKKAKLEIPAIQSHVIDGNAVEEVNFPRGKRNPFKDGAKQNTANYEKSNLFDAKERNKDFYEKKMRNKFHNQNMGENTFDIRNVNNQEIKGKRQKNKFKPQPTESKPPKKRKKFSKKRNLRQMPDGFQLAEARFDLNSMLKPPTDESDDDDDVPMNISSDSKKSVNKKPKKKLKSVEESVDDSKQEEEKGSEKRKKKRGFEGRDDTEERKGRTLFVGNLPINIDKIALRKLFMPYGKIESARIRCSIPAKQSMTKKVANITKKYHSDIHSLKGYVVFVHTEDAHHARSSLNGRLVQDHHIRVDVELGSKNYDVKRSIFVGNLPFSVEEEALWSTFSDCGTVEGVRVIRDRDTGIAKGFGYVLFRTIKSAEQALSMKDVEIEGRSIRIKPVETNPKKPTVVQPKSNPNRNSFKYKAIRQRRNPSMKKKSIKKLMNKEKTLHRKKQIANILQKK